jgi:hypothetical protein
MIIADSFGLAPTTSGVIIFAVIFLIGTLFLARKMKKPKKL